MTFDRDLLEQYHQLLCTTRLADGYGEFVRLFRFLRVQMEKELPDHTFEAGITENAMDYSYFQCTCPALKSQGLKLTVVFVHRTFSLEVWLSGYNRAQQCRWHEQLRGLPFAMAQNPARQDYILRVPVPEADLGDGDGLVQKLRDTVALIEDSIH
mgnify:FL=1